ncbi:MAG: phosphate ABC transporter substrate-binding protein [Verrucomicrobiales bacterium]|nr:phosphate ABC transporter substrate-binding protein [Verrucomicrobiales bacterium]
MSRFVLTITAAGLFLLHFTSCSKLESSEGLLITGSSTVAPLVADAAQRFEKEYPGARIDVQTGGSSRGINDVRTGLAKLGMASRALKTDESDIQAATIAMDGVCLILHSSNPVEGLTKDEITAIYQKQISNWETLGGNAADIVVTGKASGRATLEVFLGYTGLDSADIQADVIVGENQQAIKTVAGNPKAIAYVSIGAAASEALAGTPIKLISIDGIEPTTENVARGVFPITRPLNMITKGEVTGLSRTFLEYLKSDRIRDLVETHLYVPVSP